MHEERTARMALGRLVEPGNREVGELVRSVGAPEALTRVVRGSGVSERLAGAVQVRLKGAKLLGAAEPGPRIAEQMQAEAERGGARIVTAVDGEWPAVLDDLVRASWEGDGVRRNTDPPMCMWMRGPLRLDEALRRSVAVVGARSVTRYGEYVASDFAFGLAERGWTVVSGGAIGVDATAHRGALVAGGPTLAVLPCGIERPYPQSNAGMFEQIGAEGLLLSEWAPGTVAFKTRFLIRNRVIEHSVGFKGDMRKKWLVTAA